MSLTSVFVLNIFFCGVDFDYVRPSVFQEEVMQTFHVGRISIRFALALANGVVQDKEALVGDK